MIENVHKTVHVILKRSTATNTFTRTAWLRQKEGNGAVHFFLFWQSTRHDELRRNKQTGYQPTKASPMCSWLLQSSRGIRLRHRGERLVCVARSTWLQLSPLPGEQEQTPLATYQGGWSWIREREGRTLKWKGAGKEGKGSQDMTSSVHFFFLFERGRGSFCVWWGWWWWWWPWGHMNCQPTQILTPFFSWLFFLCLKTQILYFFSQFKWFPSDGLFFSSHLFFLSQTQLLQETFRKKTHPSLFFFSSDHRDV